MAVESRWWMSGEERSLGKQAVLASSAVKKVLTSCISFRPGEDDSQKKTQRTAAPKSFDHVLAHPKLHHEMVRCYYIQAPR